MEITCKNCDGVIETQKIKEFEISQGIDGDFEAIATLENGDYFLIFGERLGTIKIED